MTVTVKIFRSAIIKLQNITTLQSPMETGGVLVGTRSYHDRSLNFTVLGAMGIIEYDCVKNSYLNTQSTFCCKDKDVWADLALNAVKVFGTSYIGDWHSHPESSVLCPSKQDIETLIIQHDREQFAPFPPLHIITAKESIMAFILLSHDVILRIQPDIILDLKHKR